MEYEAKGTKIAKYIVNHDNISFAPPLTALIEPARLIRPPDTRHHATTR